MIDSCFAKSTCRSSAPCPPVVAPHVTRRPPRASARTLFGQVASPTCSMTTSTPRRFVRRLISSAMSWVWWLITWKAPSARARSTFASEPAVAKTRAPADRTVSRRRPIHSPTYDFTRDIAARDVRQWNSHPRQTAAFPDVEVVQRAGAHADQDVVGAEFGIGRLLEPQDLRSAMRMKSNGAQAGDGTSDGVGRQDGGVAVGQRTEIVADRLQIADHHRHEAGRIEMLGHDAGDIVTVV